MSFAGGALVFPGGRIDEADEALARSLELGEDGRREQRPSGKRWRRRRSRRA